MKKRIFGVIALILLVVMTLTGCKVVNKVKGFFNNLFNPPVELTAPKLEGDILIDFANGANPDVLFESDGWSNGDVFNVVWKKHNVYYGDGISRRSSNP